MVHNGVTCGAGVDGHHLGVDGGLVQVVQRGPGVVLLLHPAHRRAHALLVRLLQEVGEWDDEPAAANQRWSLWSRDPLSANHSSPLTRCWGRVCSRPRRGWAGPGLWGGHGHQHVVRSLDPQIKEKRETRGLGQNSKHKEWNYVTSRNHSSQRLNIFDIFASLIGTFLKIFNISSLCPLLRTTWLPFIMKILRLLFGLGRRTDPF